MSTTITRTHEACVWCDMAQADAIGLLSATGSREVTSTQHQASGEGADHIVNVKRESTKS